MGHLRKRPKTGEKRIIELLEKQNEMLEALIVAEAMNQQMSESMMQALVGQTGSGVDAYMNQRLLGGEGNSKLG